ncbi:SAM-dependent methyltransferase [Solibacillus silvestris StLB046]|uniref:SAM-dependent methyltransferase n=1 Tax=Solibacillus silvestris (strain StLB046) TaxID=1002809 RepID=F2F2J7_SOLSS|nr:SAM-dependent methyltransferase [Solibacillus silvestris StLB046]
MHQFEKDLTEHETRMWEHYKKIEAENYSLKNQLKNKNAIIKDW